MILLQPSIAAILCLLETSFFPTLRMNVHATLPQCTYGTLRAIPWPPDLFNRVIPEWVTTAVPVKSRRAHSDDLLLLRVIEFG